VPGVADPSAAQPLERFWHDKRQLPPASAATKLSWRIGKYGYAVSGKFWHGADAGEAYWDW
jgi:hypothetical protein